MSLDYENDGEAMGKLIEEVLEAYPEKFAKRRKKHLNVAQGTDETAEDGQPLTECDVKSNIKSVPGVMTIRGCAYAGSKGVVWGPIKDMVHISHGPVGCGQYSWSQRRNYYIGKTGIDTFVTMQFTSDFQERDIVFGGDKKLEKVIDEINGLFPLANGTTIQSECPIGLIGDDIEAVSKKKAKEHGKTVVPVRCEGFRGVSQSLGHHIANDAVRDWVFENKGGVEQNPDTAFEPATPGPPASSWRRWACAWSATGPATPRSPRSSARRRRSSTSSTATGR
jgi:nitrogenase molybdenum-iron protein alpha chain